MASASTASNEDQLGLGSGVWKGSFCHVRTWSATVEVRAVIHCIGRQGSELQELDPILQAAARVAMLGKQHYVIVKHNTKTATEGQSRAVQWVRQLGKVTWTRVSIYPREC